MVVCGSLFVIACCLSFVDVLRAACCACCLVFAVCRVYVVVYCCYVLSFDVVC